MTDYEIVFFDQVDKEKIREYAVMPANSKEWLCISGMHKNPTSGKCVLHLIDKNGEVSFLSSPEEGVYRRKFNKPTISEAEWFKLGGEAAQAGFSLSQEDQSVLALVREGRGTVAVAKTMEEIRLIIVGALLVREEQNIAVALPQKKTDMGPLGTQENPNIIYDHDKALAAVKKDGLALQHVLNQTLEICLAAVQQNGLALKHVYSQALEICLAAVQQEGTALRYILHQTPEICKAAVQQNGEALQFVRDPETYNELKELVK